MTNARHHQNHHDHDHDHIHINTQSPSQNHSQNQNQSHHRSQSQNFNYPYHHHPVRRSSYASVLSGAAHNDSFAPQHSGALAHLLHPSTPPATSSLPTADADMQLSYGATSAGRRSAGLPVYSRQFAHLPEYAYPFNHNNNNFTSSPDLSSSQPAFFIPSYLQHSRYIARLESARRARQLAAQRESSSAVPSSLSASSSHVNLHRLAAAAAVSHRPSPLLHHDAWDKDLPALENEPPPLPTCWNEADKHNGLDLLNDGLEVRYIGHQHKVDHEAASVRADHPMPRETGLYYYEATILAKPKDAVIAIGFSSSRSSLERLPGWDNESWAYHGDDGKAFIGESQGQGRPYGPTFAMGDTIGCGVNFATGTCFFTKNGHNIGTAFRDLQASRHVTLYPAIGVKRHPSMHIKTNFGQQPFMFDIDSVVKKEKARLLSEVDNTSIASIQPPLDDVTLLQEIVAQFLSQEGYYDTARAFAEEVRQESGEPEDSTRPVFRYEQEQDVDATNRQKIRTAILDGDIDKALKYTNAYFPSVLQDNPNILFKLRCRKFLEMMCKCSDLSNATSLKRTKPSNGVPHAHEPVFEQDMELDDHMHDGFSDDADGMETEETGSVAKFQELLTEAVQYGQQLRMDYPTDEQGGDKQYLEDIFSLVAYPDPRASVHGHYLDASGRTAVADELNSAILVSLGKSSAAALETLYSQTEVLINELSEGGGVGAFINIPRDFLS